jgi:hypothetical protein
VIGLQKIVTQNVRGMLQVDKEFLQGQIKAVLEGLNQAAPGDNYQLLTSVNMFSLHTFLLAKQSIHTRVNQIQTSVCQKYEKGAASIRFKIADTSFCFLNCHLESGIGKEMQQRRF